MAFAALAIALKVLIPAGFMAAPDRNGSPFAVVLCTGQGAKVVEPGGLMSAEHDAPDQKAPHDPPCPFAGHGAAALASPLFAASHVEFAAYAPPVAGPAAHPAPGRGLAAPPLPARGPPSQLI